MSLQDAVDFLDFVKQMVNMLKKKQHKHGDTWKTRDFNSIIPNLDYQKKKLDKLVEEYNTWLNEENPLVEYVKINLKDTLLDIANYCFFLYYKIGDTMIL